MKKLCIILIALFIVLFANVAWASRCETITVSSTAVGGSTSLIGQANFTPVYAFCTVENFNIRVFYDGVNTPTASVGQIVYAPGRFTVRGKSNIQNLLMIRTTSDSTVTCCYE